METANKQQLLSGFNMPCHVCREPSKSQCPSCKTRYCSKACQRADWKNGHKKQCKMLTKEFQRGYAEGGLQPKKKEAPPVVMIPDFVRPKLDIKETNEAPKAAEEKDPSGGESCPICLELLSNEGKAAYLRKAAYLPCCGNYICGECFKKCDEIKGLTKKQHGTTCH